MTVAGLSLLCVCGQANAGGFDSFEGGSTSLGKSIVKPDGKIQMVGYPSFLVQLRKDGTPDPSFSNGGVRFTDVADPVDLLSAGGGSSILVSEDGLRKFKDDGSPDTTFGEGGIARLPAEPVTMRMTAASVQSDGKVVVGAFEEGSTRAVVARFKVDGELDGSFGGDGVIQAGDPSPGHGLVTIQGIGIDSLNRIVVVRGDYSRVEAMRFLPGGIPDPDFGTDGAGYSEQLTGDFYLAGPVNELAVDPDGAFRAYAVYRDSLYYVNNSLFFFNSEGDPSGPPLGVRGQGTGAITETPEGYAHSYQYDSKADLGETPRFVIGVASRTSYSEVFGLRDFPTSPGDAWVNGLTYSSSDDSLIATGVTANGSGTVGAVVKLDARTGAPDPVFGTDGTVLVPRNECSFGIARRLPDTSIGQWQRCRVMPPAVKAKFRFSHARSRRPALRGTVSLSRTDARPEYLDRRITITLPRRLGLRRGHVRKNLTVSDRGTWSDDELVSVTGKKIVVDIVPGPEDDNPVDPSVPADESLKLWFTLKRGALKAVPGKLRRKKLTIQAQAVYSPVEKWYGPNSGSATNRVRPVR